jgi:hypothetical protein
MKSPFMAGVAAKFSTLSDEDVQRIRAAGIGWLRLDMDGLDQVRFLRGEKQPEGFDRMREKIVELRSSGFQIMGITPSPHRIVPEAGATGSPGYNENYRRLCVFLGRQFRGLIDYWQVANEVDIWIFRASLTLDQAVEFLKAGLRGLKEADAQLQVGINLTLFPSRPGEIDGNTEQHEGLYVATRIYRDPGVKIDYAGFDSYPGTWREGGVESWHEYLDGFHDLVRKPIIIQEFGYSSAGEMMSDTDSKSGASPCQLKKWKFAWRGAHTPEIQADFITESYRIFAEKPFVIGATYYCWKDSARCWQCGSPDCPAETAWGLVDRNNELKPSYYSLRSSLAALRPA